MTKRFIKCLSFLSNIMISQIKEMWRIVNNTYQSIRTHSQRIAETQQTLQSLDNTLRRIESKAYVGNVDLVRACLNLNLAYLAAQAGDREMFERCGQRIYNLSRPYL